MSSSLARLANVWRSHEDGAARRAQAALLVASLLATAHLARLGTPLGRGLAIGIVAGLLVAFIARSLVSRATYRSPRATLRKTVGKTDPDLGAKALRALGLVEQSARDPQATSPELARLHFDRTLERIGEERIEARAALAARRWQYLGVFAGILAIGAVLRGPFRVVEGLDVLFAQKGEAPLAFDWLDNVQVVATPPAYLHQNQRFRLGFGRMSLPRGTTLTIRGNPVHEGRQIVLFDQEQEVPFVADGSGGLIARFTLGESTTLRVAARFGEVRIPQAGSFELVSIPDETPLVVLEGAPRLVRLIEEPEVTIAYEARDDHGLREIHLVLRTGDREDRRVLAKLDGETRVHRGAMRLRSSDPFFSRTFVPVEVTVEARDDDPITGPKWGRSEALILLPPAIGEPEALRYAALQRARDAFIDLLAFRAEAEVGKTKAEKRAHVDAEALETEKAMSLLYEAVGGLHGGKSFPRRTSLVLRSEASKLDAALAAEAKKTTPATHDKLVTATEDAVLALDTALRALGARDAAAVSKKLADVADDAARGAEMAQTPSDRARGVARLSAANEVLQEGGVHLSTLGSLGADLGEIVENGVRRIRRAQGQNDFFHAELAAKDLAARLRNPVPSFSGGGGGGGVEAGGGTPDPGGDGGDMGDLEGEIARQQRDLEDLARDHAAEMAEVERALREALSEDAMRDAMDEARRRAERLREVADALQHLSGGPETAESSAATGREHAEAMAGALERGSMADAVESGRRALQALEEAQRKPSAFSPYDDARVHELARRARNEVSEHLAFAEKALEQMRAQASKAARERLKEAAKREGRLADRARELAQQGQDGPAAMPEELLDLLKEAEGLMREAEKALDAADGEKALDRQRNAQRLLERAREAGEDGENANPEERMAQNEGRGGQGESDRADPWNARLPIPSADQHKGPEDFRRRVLEGLGGSTDPRLKEAVKRYAEGLLR